MFTPTGAVVIPPYSDPRDFVRYNGGPDVPAQAIAVRAYQPGWNTVGEPVSAEELRVRLQTSQVFVFDLVRWKLFDLSATWQPDRVVGQASASFDGTRITSFESQTLNGTEVVTLTWQSVGIVQDRQAFVHIYDASGKLVAQDDGIPAQDLAPTSWWRVGDVITDTHLVHLDRLPSGTYRVTVGMYDAANGVRTEARGADGARLPEDELATAQITR